jgi:acyl-coenzyme A thioesterase PaaI-like protein
VADGAGAGSGAFDRDTAVRRLDGRPSSERAGSPFQPTSRRAWHVARGPHGGYLAAILLRALTDAADEQTPQARSLTIHFVSVPRPGPMRVRTALERRGRSLSSLSARMEQDGKLIALALAAFSIPWRAPEVAELPMPAVAAPDPRARDPQRADGADRAGPRPGVSHTSRGPAADRGTALQRL